jgi:hypothetical protein
MVVTGRLKGESPKEGMRGQTLGAFRIRQISGRTPRLHSAERDSCPRHAVYLTSQKSMISQRRSEWDAHGA